MKIEYRQWDTSHNRTVTASPLRRLGVQSARSVATLTPTPPSPTFGRAVLLRKPLLCPPKRQLHPERYVPFANKK